MSGKLTVCVILALSLTTSPFALAQEWDRHAPQAKESRQDSRRSHHRHSRQPRYLAPPYVVHPHSDGRGAGSNHQFHRGHRLAPEYRHYHYVVDDWDRHGLRRPPRGHHWVQSGGDYILVAIATGIILEILLNQ